jgi:NADH-ubiquinone oxidoreductase chain 2
MLINLIILQLLSSAITQEQDKSIIYSRIAIFILLYTCINIFLSLFIEAINKGIALFTGLFFTSSLILYFNLFILIIAILVLMLTSFFPLKKLNRNNLIEMYKFTARKEDLLGSVFISPKEDLSINNNLEIDSSSSSRKKTIFNRVIHLDEYFNNIINKTNLDNVSGEQYKIIEYSLIILFIITGSSFLISSNDIISIFLCIELQSYGLYLLCTLYRNSESSTSGGLTYFLLGGLSSCFILLGLSLLYANSGITNLDSLYIISNISEIMKISYLYGYT